jgi:hypothetical protein
LLQLIIADTVPSVKDARWPFGINAGNILRWSVIAGFAGLGICAFIDGMGRISTQVDDQGATWWFWLVALLVLLSLSSLCISIAYLIFRRHYARLGKLVSIVVGLLAYSFFSSLPKQFGYTERGIDFPWSVFIGLLLTVVSFCGAYWVYRAGQTFISRFVNGNERVDQRIQN